MRRWWCRCSPCAAAAAAVTSTGGTPPSLIPPVPGRARSCRTRRLQRQARSELDVVSTDIRACNVCCSLPAAPGASPHTPGARHTCCLRRLDHTARPRAPPQLMRNILKAEPDADFVFFGGDLVGGDRVAQCQSRYLAAPWWSCEPPSPPLHLPAGHGPGLDPEPAARVLQGTPLHSPWPVARAASAHGGHARSPCRNPPFPNPALMPIHARLCDSAACRNTGTSWWRPCWRRACPLPPQSGKQGQAQQRSRWHAQRPGAAGSGREWPCRM